MNNTPFNMLKNRFLYAFCCVFFNVTLFAQAPQQQLEQVVQAYTAFQSFSAPLDYPSLTPEQKNRITGDIEQGLAFSQKLAASSEGQYAALGRYFKTQFAIAQIGYLALTGQQAAASKAITALQPDIETIGESFFPRDYTVEGKNYTIRWVDFAPDRAGYYRFAAENSLQSKSWSQALEEAQRTVQHPFARPYDRLLARVVEVAAMGELGQNNSVRMQTALDGLQLFDRLAPVQQSALTSGGRNVLSALYSGIKNSTPDGGMVAGEFYARVARALAPYPEALREAADATRRAFENGNNDRSFAENAFDFAIRQADAPAAKNDPQLAEALRSLAITAVAAIETHLSCNDCTGYKTQAQRYISLNNKAKEAEMNLKFLECEKVNQDAYNAENPEFHWLITTQFIPIFTFNRTYRDAGIVLNLGGRYTFFEFSYLRVRQNRDYLLDLRLQGDGVDDVDDTYWSGFYTHFGMKFVNRKRNFRRNSKGYRGFLISYNERAFNAIETGVVDAGGNASMARFEPRAQQYGLMFNAGFMGMQVLALDIYISLGAAYTTFDRGNDQYSPSAYFIDNALLRKRRDSFVTPMGRIGLSVGIGR